MPTPYRSSLPRKPSTLHLTQRLRAAQNGDDGDHANGRQHLEQVPAAVVKEEDALHRNDRAEKDGMGDRRGTERLGEVIEVRAEEEPLFSKKTMLVTVTGTSIA